MIEEEYPISIEDLKKKFHNWFGKPIPAEPPLPAEAEHSTGKPVPVDLSVPYESIHLDREAHSRHADNAKSLSEMLNLGLSGAATSGAVVGGLIVVLNLSFPGWYSNTWPNQFLIILLAILLGFNIGLSRGYVAQQREKYFYKGEF